MWIIRLTPFTHPIVSTDATETTLSSVACSIVKKSAKLDKISNIGKLRILLIMHKHNIQYPTSIAQIQLNQNPVF
jgi:hypothetical protein